MTLNMDLRPPHVCTHAHTHANTQKENRGAEFLNLKTENTEVQSSLQCFVPLWYSMF